MPVLSHHVCYFLCCSLSVWAFLPEYHRNRVCSRHRKRSKFSLMHCQTFLFDRSLTNSITDKQIMHVHNYFSKVNLPWTKILHRITVILVSWLNIKRSFHFIYLWSNLRIYMSIFTNVRKPSRTEKMNPKYVSKVFWIQSLDKFGSYFNWKNTFRLQFDFFLMKLVWAQSIFGAPFFLTSKDQCKT
jgi:hypothetical protein